MERLIAYDLGQDPELDHFLRIVIVGGERLIFSRLSRWFERYPRRRIALFNLYGPTEATVLSTLYPLDREIVRQAGNTVISGAP